MAEHPETPADETPPQLQPVQPRRNPSTHRAAATTANLTDLVNLVKSVQALAEDQVAGGGSSHDSNARRTKKFSRSGSGDERAPRKPVAVPSVVAPEPPLVPPPAVVEPVSAPAVDETETAGVGTPIQQDAEVDPSAIAQKNVAWPRLVKEPDPDAPLPARRRPAPKRRNNLGAWALGQMFSFGLIALGYWLARQTGPSVHEKPAADDVPAAAAAVPVIGSTVRVSERAFDAVNFALHATKSGDVASARQLYESAFKLEPAPPGTSYRLALLAWQGGDLPETERQLTRSIQAGEDVGACCYIRARMAWDQGDLAESVRQLQIAAHAEPFDGRYLFYWGEALRRQGKARSALECLEQALDRSNRPEDVQLYAFKLRLIRAGNGHDERLGAEMAEGLQQPAGASGWHLVAAAQAIARSAFPEAASHLNKASSTMSPAKYDVMTRDFVFQESSNQAALITSLNRPAPATDSKVRPDPVSASPEIADPALWPAPAGAH